MISKNIANSFNYYFKYNFPTLSLKIHHNKNNSIYYSNKYKFSILNKTQQKIKYKYRFDSGFAFKPHPNKFVYNGDDAYFVSPNLIAIADGVGSNQHLQTQQNSKFAKKLIYFIQKIYKNQTKAVINSPMYAVQQALKLVKIIGSTTITIISLNQENGKLSTYYLGDSVYGFFRKEQVEMSEPQMISFNKPYQVGYGIGDVKKGYQNTYESQQIAQDLLIVGTDGLWDNLTLDRLHYQVRGPNSIYKNGLPKSLKQIADTVVDLAYKYSLSSNYQSPFYKKAIKNNIKYPKQGKVDDITVVLARILKQQNHKI